VRVNDPSIEKTLKKDIIKLSHWFSAHEEAQWKIVFGHHPMYTQGVKHSLIGRCLRDATYTVDPSSDAIAGYGLEDVLVHGGARVYISGHEHVCQHHVAQGVHHFVVGATCEAHFYGGRDVSQPVEWVDESMSRAFLSMEIYVDRIVAKFVSFAPQQPATHVILKEVIIPHCQTRDEGMHVAWLHFCFFW
jgi:hypothetical protein